MSPRGLQTTAPNIGRTRPTPPPRRSPASPVNTTGDADEEFETLTDEVIVVEADPVGLFCTVLPLTVDCERVTEACGGFVVPADTGDVEAMEGEGRCSVQLHPECPLGEVLPELTSRHQALVCSLQSQV